MTIPCKIIALATLAAALVAGFSISRAQAATVVTDTIVQQQEVPDTIKVNFIEFDANKDGSLSRREVGDKLFYIFDTDGNEVIDNIEYTKPRVLSVIPMEKQIITSVDFNDDGRPDRSSFNQEEFMRQSLLYKFDQNKDGLSAKDFLGQVYWQLDDNKDKTVDLAEFEAAYIESTMPSAANPNRYNQ
jgi:hypothetical protein